MADVSEFPMTGDSLKVYETSSSGPSDYWNYHGYSDGQGRVDFICTGNILEANTSNSGVSGGTFTI